MIFPSLIIICSVFIQESSSRILKDNVDLCNSLVCDEIVPVCGIRSEGKGFILKRYDNECKMLKEICGHDNKVDYGIINLKYCDKAFKTKPNCHKSTNDKCRIKDCPYSNDTSLICAIREDGDGFRLHQFEGPCDLWLHNCRHNVKFVEDDAYLCDGLDDESIKDEDTDIQEIQEEMPVITDGLSLEIQNHTLPTNVIAQRSKWESPMVVIVDNLLTFMHKNITRTIDAFFETTHIFDLPLQELNKHTVGSGRRMWIKNAGPLNMFTPWVRKPKNVSEDYMHAPLLSSCYHKCPTYPVSIVTFYPLSLQDITVKRLTFIKNKCPKTYAPVCGVPGTKAREPSLMFQNHCFMDVAQCKMRWEDKSPTAISSGYKESPFIFCLGDELNSLYRFLPLIRTLQHMGRLKNKGYFREKITNMRYLNNIISKQPNLMG